MSTTATAVSHANGITNPSAKNILIISAAYSLHGTPIAGGIEKEWSSKASPEVRSAFNNVGFDFILEDVASSLLELRQMLRDQRWDGAMVGWCIRGMGVELTEIFEGVMREVIDAAREQKDLKAMFCRGPDDLVNTTLRSFPLVAITIKVETIDHHSAFKTQRTPAESDSSDAHSELFDVIIIGAGPCGLATAARLRERHPSALFTDEEQARYAWIARNARRSTIKNKRTGQTKAGSDAGLSDRGLSTLVLDSLSDQWMAKWNALFAKFEISHLRSPMFFHTDPSDRDALLAFAYEQERMEELEEIPGCVGKEVNKHKRTTKKASRKSSSAKLVVEVDERNRKDYFTPSSSCFRDFCESCIRRYDLQKHIIRQETVVDIQYDSFLEIDRDNRFSDSYGPG